jgi:hypothetical protein
MFAKEHAAEEAMNALGINNVINGKITKEVVEVPLNDNFLERLEKENYETPF